MTAVAALVHRGETWLAADTQVSQGLHATDARQSKIWRDGSLLLGGTGLVRELQVVRFTKLPPTPAGKAGRWTTAFDRWLHVELVEAIRSALRRGGRLQKKDEVESYASEFLVCAAGRIFTLDSVLAVVERREPFDAIGSGREYALGALAAFDGSVVARKFPPRYRVERAVRIAARFDMGVGGRVKILREGPS